MKRRTPPAWLTHAFIEEAMSWYLHGEPGVPEQALRHFDGGPACWLHQFDPLERPCSGDLQGIHLIGKREIRRVVRFLLTTDPWADGAVDPADVDDLVEFAEWDPRVAAPGCKGHHDRFDSLATPTLIVPAKALRPAAIAYIHERGLEAEATRKFSGELDDGAAARFQLQTAQHLVGHGGSEGSPDPSSAVVSGERASGGGRSGEHLRSHGVGTAAPASPDLTSAGDGAEASGAATPSPDGGSAVSGGCPDSSQRRSRS